MKAELRAANRIPTLSLSLFWLFSGPAGVGAADILEQATALLQDGRRAEALSLYSTWLDRNPADPGADQILRLAAPLTDSPSEAAAWIAARRPLLRDPGARFRAGVDLAGLYELTGELEAAILVWQDILSERPENSEALLRMGRLQLVTGRTEEARDTVGSLSGRELSGDDKYRLTLLAADTDSALGREDRAEASLRTLLEESRRRKDPGVASRLWFLYSRDDNVTAARDMERYLQDVFSLTPEALVVAGRGQPWPSPALILSGIPGARVPDPVLVQVGSFGRRENAETLADEVRAAGFEVDIRNTGDAYRVVVRSREDVESTLESLRSAGYPGFRLYP